MRASRVAVHAVSGEVGVRPIAPCTWIARSTTSWSMRAPTTLISAICSRANALVETTRGVQRQQPACLDIGGALEHVGLQQLLCRPAVRRKPSRECMRRHIRSNARCACRASACSGRYVPGPRRCCAIRKPWPAQAQLGDRAGTRTSLERDFNARPRCEHRRLADDPVARIVGRHDDHAEAVVRLSRPRRCGTSRVVLGRAGGARREPPLAIDDPFVAHETRRGAQLSRVRSSPRRLGD